MTVNPGDEAALAAERQRAAQRELEARNISEAIRDAVAAIDAVQAQARDDVAIADALAGQADSLSAAITSRLAAVAAFTPSATYNASQLVAIKGEIVWLLQQVKALTEAQSGMYAWRGAVDRNAVLTDEALMGLARLATRYEGALR